ncbi:nitrogen regulation protein NR(I) [Paralcaligenes sp. KSB-10]|uniref:nitrogen regulation protein NR(I) n=1 Tax=Paralcaligenes sp. KSB-10 TaxID=2901142 RepID=UPI001E4DD6C1|nr:nitrogen regulation protein NR(I) [Paralcaligenes sp. KSB-10]UHL64723.1 nitrogen regulation protein NR(I) [Paralcaligenes sp. KSB-10]
MKPVWIVDDDQSIRWVLEKALARASIDAQSFTSAAAVLEALKDATPAVLVTDVRMPGQDGLSLLQAIKQRHPGLAVIVMTAFTDLDSTVSAFQKGAFDYLAKPFDVNEAVALIRRAAQEQDPQDQAQQSASGSAMLQSSSLAMQEVFRAIGRLATSRATVLITGESGTGKELIARALHTHSARADGPFIALNAAAIPRDLLEAELFGHERGAFTGATNLRRGRFEAAHGGTLFLDEIGDMPLELQTRLLRVLAEGSFYRVGGSQAVTVDVRIVAATHQPLEQRVAQGQFREDLFHRLNVIRLRLPPLRERKEDIPALAQLFLENSARSLGVPVRRLTPEALRALMAFDYPGNIRQLENFCHWLSVMSASQLVNTDDLPPEIGAPAATPIALISAGHPHTEEPVAAQGPDWTAMLAKQVKEKLVQGEPAIMSTLTRDFERVLLRIALGHSHGKRVEAAQRLGIGRNTLTRKCQELGLDDE